MRGDIFCTHPGGFYVRIADQHDPVAVAREMARYAVEQKQVVIYRVFAPNFVTAFCACADGTSYEHKEPTIPSTHW